MAISTHDSFVPGQDDGGWVLTLRPVSSSAPPQLPISPEGSGPLTSAAPCPPHPAVVPTEHTGTEQR